MTLNDSTTEEDDVGALIYRESQLRKAEAAATTAERKTSTASTHQRRTSTRKRSPVTNHEDISLPMPTGQRKSSSKKKRKECTNIAVRGGLFVKDVPTNTCLVYDTQFY